MNHVVINNKYCDASATNNKKWKYKIRRYNNTTQARRSIGNEIHC